MPSRVLIGLLGALGLRQQLMATGKRRKGRGKNVRLVWALEWVRDGLLPFVRTPNFVGGCAGDVVVPPEGPLDSTVPVAALRRAPITMVLGALVAIYLSLPNRSDPEGRARKDQTPGDPEKLKIPSTLLEETTDALRKLAKHLKQQPARKQRRGRTPGAK